MCLFFSLLLFGPRLAGALWWLLQPMRWDATFTTFLIPVIGLVFLPWTTVMYVLVAPGGVHGMDLIWLLLAVLADVSSYAGGGVYGRRRQRTIPA
jgi:hypothetical protein